jgi:colanic acid biosynthesis glycosyl transferase WcaI
MARILLLTLVFRPDNVSTAQIMGDLALDLQSRGHTLQVITTIPHYNRDAEADARQPLRSWLGGVIRRSDYNGIPVYHVFIPQKGGNKLLRMVGWMGFHLGSLLLGSILSFKPEIILAPSPPLTIGVVAWFLGKLRRCPWVYNVQEIYPDIAINLGELRNPSLIRFFQRLERFVYRSAAGLAVISEGMVERILAKGVPREKVHLIPNFVDLTEFVPGEKCNPFSLEHGLQDQLVVLYAGNMGKPQGLDVLIDAAALLRDERGIRFVLMGTGSERAALEERARVLKLSNVLFLGQQPYNSMGAVHATASICFVSQAPRTASDGIPSKVFRILGSGRPILASTSSDSDLARIVRNAEGGSIVPPGDPDAIAATLRKALVNQSEWAALGMRGREYVKQHFSRPMIAERYHQLLTQLARSTSRNS